MFEDVDSGFSIRVSSWKFRDDWALGESGDLAVLPQTLPRPPAPLHHGPVTGRGPRGALVFLEMKRLVTGGVCLSFSPHQVVPGRSLVFY